MPAALVCSMKGVQERNVGVKGSGYQHTWLKHGDLKEFADFAFFQNSTPIAILQDPKTAYGFLVQITDN